MEWVTTQHLDLRPMRSALQVTQQQQPQCGAFHHSQALFAAAVGNHITEFDALTGCKLSSIDIGGIVVRMAYSPAGGHLIIAVLEDWTIRSWDLDTEHTHVLYSPERKTDKIVGSGMEVHIALTPLRPWLFFGAHRHMSVNVVGTVEGARAATKIKTDLKKPISELACHPRSPLLYVAYADGLIRAYHIQTFTVQYTLQIDSSIKLIGAGAFAFHSTLEWVFIGDRSGTLLAWDVSVPTQPSMIGITQVGSTPIAAVAWHPMLRLLMTLSKDGSVQVWRARVVMNPNRPPMRANFFELAGVETMDVANILTQSGGEAIYPLPRIVDLLVHPKLNLATVLFASVASGDDTKTRASSVSREVRKQLFSVLQSARGTPVLKEKLAVLGSAGVLPDHQLQLQQARGQSGHTQLTMSDFARKAFLYGKSADRKSRKSTMLSLPLLTIADPNHHLRDIPVCQPFQQELNFFNSELGIFLYPLRVFFMDGCNLMAYNLSSGDYNIYKKFSPTALGGNERYPKHMLYSTKQHSFLIFFECRGATSEMVLYRESLAAEMVGERVNTVIGRDGAFVGYNENQYAILDEDGLGLTLYFLEDISLTSSSQLSIGGETNGALDPSSFSESKLRTREEGQMGSVQFVFDNPVQRIFSSPLESCFLYVCAGSHIGLARVFASAYGTGVDLAGVLSTRPEDGRLLKLNSLETVLQVRWQELPSGQAAAIMTTQRVLIASANLEILSSSSTIFDKGFPPFRSVVWVGPALLFSTATTVAVLGWDGLARPIVTIGTPNAALISVLNDRVLLASTNDPNPRQKQSVEIKTRLVGLLEPLLIGWATMQLLLEPKLDMSEIMYKLTSRFDSHRITPQSLNVLASGPSVCGDLAVELAQAGPQFSQVTCMLQMDLYTLSEEEWKDSKASFLQELRCRYAISARRFTTSLSILKDEFLRSRDYPRCPPTSRLFQRFRELGHACIKYAQFDHAKETFEVVSDFQSMIDLFICHLNPSALRRLAQKLEETGADPELRRQCEKILSVRSTGWGQGGVFSNLAAESMAPKGPEWGGGNWEIKTHPEVKSFPDWELSGEVTAYMKTPNGAIPTILPDHIGVYLGTLKGRGTVVEVREDAIIPKLANGENGIESLGLVLARSGSGVSKVSEEASPHGSKAKANLLLLSDSKVNASLNGKETLTDEQSKAAEEFKKGMYKVDDSSSDDDEAATTKKKKIQIRIREKSATGTAVDVDKVKEATRQFKLGDGLTPLGTKPKRPSGGSQEFSSSTFPHNFAAQELSMPRTSVDGPPPMMMGVGVTAGPIPEDFFQGNGSGFGTGMAVQSNAIRTGAPPFEGGLWTSGINVPAQAPLYPVPQVNQGDLSFMAGSPSSLPNSASFDVTPGSVPPQIAMRPVNLDLSLPDGGIPPQAKMQNQGSAFPTPDLGIFEKTSGLAPSGTSGDVLPAAKNPARPASPPRMMRPGQVPRGAPASKCFPAALAHLEQNQLSDALSCLDESFLALAKDRSLGIDIKKQTTICAKYKVAVLLLQEIARLQRVEGPSAASAKEEMARLSRHLSSLPLLAKHRLTCIRTAIKRNMDVQNYAFSKSLLDLLLSKAPTNKQDELKALIGLCIQRGLTDRTIDDTEDASQFCAATLSRLPTIGHDSCDLCESKFSALSSPGCMICGMGTIRRSDAAEGSFASPF
ncbi:hypothetical protein O6H91_07G125900 [Diphasiastrum complanatum]|uniref:Uncharacterized protein n=1 Tax=Diphasiastrum complanatum TaxID=34168 RepID=A0ACC2DA19_DIPCM|nr:hypothetical protein O6H91_07G125900 [Diphasiastrum complanatum]